MKLYSYPIPRDFGFAPNPYGGYCTLATCKPDIRKLAEPGDWVVANGPVTNYNKKGFLFSAMKIEEKMSFNDYWVDQRFQFKKPSFNGSLAHCYGDNIYFFDIKESKWFQANSHHSQSDGTENVINRKNDTSGRYVLISSHFYYFGKNNIEIPERLKEQVCHNLRIPKYKIVDPEVATEFLEWLESTYSPGLYGDPMEFDKGFLRYSGE